MAVATSVKTPESRLLTAVASLTADNLDLVAQLAERLVRAQYWTEEPSLRIQPDRDGTA